MDSWDSTLRPVRSGYNPQDVQRICVRNRKWQAFRLSLKGKSTRDKLARLAEWYDGFWPDTQGSSKWEREVQVGNYLGALRRGGQLNMNNEVQR